MESVCLALLELQAQRAMNGSTSSHGSFSTIAGSPYLRKPGTAQGGRGDERSFDTVLMEAKRRVIANILASEFTVLTRLLARIAAGHYTTRDYTAERLRAAFELFILHFPIYRTYITASGPSR